MCYPWMVSSNTKHHSVHTIDIEYKTEDIHSCMLFTYLSFQFHSAFKHTHTCTHMNTHLKIVLGPWPPSESPPFSSPPTVIFVLNPIKQHTCVPKPHWIALFCCYPQTMSFLWINNISSNISRSVEEELLLLNFVNLVALVDLLTILHVLSQ